MEKGWFKRFENAINASGKTYREISLGANLRAGYLHDVITKQQDPSVSRFLAICRSAAISPMSILLGVERTPELDELEVVFSRMSAEQQEKFLDLLESMSPERV